mgnify:CR=1 FL=1
MKTIIVSILGLIIVSVLSCKTDESGYNCNSGICTAAFENPQYLTLADCQSLCGGGSSAGYICVSNNCISVSSGAQYATLIDCQCECGDDVTFPTITITGDTAITLNLGDSYTDAGATANDDNDGDLTAQITSFGIVDVNKVGIYEIVYTVSDEAGNTTTETRTVTVKADRLAGNYNVHAIVAGVGAGTYDYVENVTASSATYNKFFFDGFSGYPGLLVEGFVNGDAITFNQIVNYDWDNSGIPYNANITGSSVNAYTVTAGAIPLAEITTLTYTINYGSGQIDFVTATYTKQ